MSQVGSEGKLNAAIKEWNKITEQYTIDAKEAERLNTFDNIITKMRETYKAKNRDYGNSFDRLCDHFVKLGYPHEIVFALRAMDKINRIETLAKKQAEVKDEKLMDTVLDLANYSVMYASYLMRKDDANERRWHELG